jgi:hypothetical protein
MKNYSYVLTSFRLKMLSQVIENITQSQNSTGGLKTSDTLAELREFPPKTMFLPGSLIVFIYLSRIFVKCLLFKKLMLGPGIACYRGTSSNSTARC